MHPPPPLPSRPQMFDGTVTGIEPEKDEETGKDSDVLLYTVTYEDGDWYGRHRRPARLETPRL